MSNTNNRIEKANQILNLSKELQRLTISEPTNTTTADKFSYFDKLNGTLDDIELRVRELRRIK